jgi:N-acylglucosamine 2-epimerase
MTPSKQQISEIRKRYETELFENVIPFWEKHSPDFVNGGFYNCLDRDGTVYDTTKHMWLQGRETWLFSKLYCDVAQKPEWLKIAKNGADFLKKFGLRESDNRAYFSVTENGKPVFMQRKIFSECFWIMAMAEYSRASGEAEYMRLAQEEFARVWDWAFDWKKVGRPHFEGAESLQNLAVPMILLNLIEELDAGSTTSHRREIEFCIERMLLHVHGDKKLVFENVSLEGEFVNTPAGRHLNPGHAIEAAWFLQHWAARLSRPDLQDRAIEMVRWSHDLGWDKEWGGYFYFLDSAGYSPTQLEWNMKLWWPHCEALYAHLLNFSITSEASDWERFVMVDAYTFSRFRDPLFGEWYGYLDKRGEVTHRFKGGPYKCAFHVPRALWLCWRKLQQLEA